MLYDGPDALITNKLPELGEVTDIFIIVECRHYIKSALQYFEKKSYSSS